MVDKDEFNFVGLKIEKNEVYKTTKDSPKEWKPAKSEFLGDIEEFVRKLERFNFPSVTSKENVIFENEKDIGTGIIKDFIDRDGDKTYQFQPIEEKEVEINEDMEFEREFMTNNHHNSPPDTINREKFQEEINHWGNASTVSTPVEPEKAKEPETPPFFKKRAYVSRTDPIMVERDTFRSMLLKNSVLTKENILGEGSFRPRKVRFQASNKEFNRTEVLSGKLVVSEFKYFSRKKVPNTPASKFYLTPTIEEKPPKKKQMIKKQ